MKGILKNSKTVHFALPFLGGLLYAGGFPIKGIPHFFFLTFIGVFLFLQSLSAFNPSKKYSFKREILSLLCFSIGYCYMGYYWIPFTLKEFGAIPIPFNYVLGTLFSLFIVPQYLLLLLLFFLLNKFPLKEIPFFLKKSSSQNILLALLLTLLESLTPQQFPAHLGHTWLQLSPYLGLAPLFGVAGFSFFSYWLILSILKKVKEGHWDLLAIISFSFFLFFNFVFPLKKAPINSNLFNIRMVQANVGNFMKLNSEKGNNTSLKEINLRYFDLSTRGRTNDLDLVIWPETAYPHLMNSSLMRMNPQYSPYLFRKVIEKSRAELFVGGYDKSSQNNDHFYETEFNTTFHFGKDSLLKDIYHKRVLIPFGESLPFGPLNPYLAKIIKNVSFFAKGDRYTLFEGGKNSRWTTAICYEILFSRFIRNYLNYNEKNPHFIINLTNDSWYGDTSEPYQHQFLTHWRALEFQIPVVRMTNTGISSILFEDGSQSKSLGVYQKNFLDVGLPITERVPTLFQRLGTLPIIGLAIVLFLLSLIRMKAFFKKVM
jgi:apolipoprotein N-acyltransferase